MKLLRMLMPVITVLYPVTTLADSGPQGIFLFPTPTTIQNGDYQKAMAVHGVDGAAVVLNWSDIEPHR